MAYPDFQKKKYTSRLDITAFSMARAWPDDPVLCKRIPKLGFQQGSSHDVYVPGKRKDLPAVATNFKKAVKEGRVELWYLAAPAWGGGAVFLSPVERDGKHGLQVEDVIVRECLRGIGMGSAMIRFVASLARERGLEFLAWECEEINPAQKMYRELGAVPDKRITSVRVDKATLSGKLSRMARVRAGEPPEGSSCSISPRYSIFRTMCHDIPGYAMDPAETCSGLQIDDIQAGSADEAIHMLLHRLRPYSVRDELNFADLIITKSGEVHREIAAWFHAATTTYSGSAVTLWELKDMAFELAAMAGRNVKIERI